MTPEQARKLLEGTTPGPWEADDAGTPEAGIWSPTRIIFGVYIDRQDMPQWEHGKPEDTQLMAAAPGMAAMIAGMTTEYAIEYQPNPSSEWYRVSDWSEEYPLIDGEELNPRERIGKRYVTAP